MNLSRNAPVLSKLGGYSTSYVRDVVKALTMFQKANVPVLGMIENMSYWSCPDCGRVDHIFGEGGVKAEAKKRDIELLGEIPISAEVRKSSDSGIPIIISEPQSIQSKSS